VLRPAHLVGRRWWPIHATAALTVTGGIGASAFLALYLRGARGASVAAAAFAVLWPTLGWSISAWVSSKLQERLHPQAVALMGTGILTLSSAAATVTAQYRSPVPLLFAAFFCMGWGVGAVTTSCLSLLQQQTDDREMGRLSSAHQFVRSLGFTYGPAVAGMVIFTAVDLRTGDVEAVRDLLSDSGALNPATAEALASAYALALGVTAAICAIAVPAGLTLARRYNPDKTTRD